MYLTTVHYISTQQTTISFKTSNFTESNSTVVTNSNFDYL